MSRRLPSQPVPGWTYLQRIIMQLSEPEVQALLDAELAFKKRKPIIARLYGRLSTLRKKREKEALLG